ncbi:hypothetical protein RB213_004666 [Colletotrichum asianum]
MSLGALETETKGSSTANGPFTDARASPLTLCWRGANPVVDPPKIPDLAPPGGRRELNVGSVEMTNWRVLSRLSAKLSAAEYWRPNGMPPWRIVMEGEMGLVGRSVDV